MSRIGKTPVIIPEGLSATIDQGILTVTGQKDSLTQPILEGVKLKIEDNQLIVTRISDELIPKANHGLMRSLANNMVEGLSKGFKKQLEVNGVGYRVSLQGTDLKFNLGFSHDVTYHIPAGITASVDQNIITISGINKQQVGQVSAEIRALKKPEPYKGKGIKYVGERIIRKSGKSGKEK